VVVVVVVELVVVSLLDGATLVVRSVRVVEVVVAVSSDMDEQAISDADAAQNESRANIFM
jgi:hypothetical protein